MENIMKTRHLILNALFAAGISLTMAGCSDTWDEHYTPDDSTVNNNDVEIVDASLTQYLSEESSIASMYQLLEETGLIEQMNQREQLYTVLAVEGDTRVEETQTGEDEADSDKLYTAQSHVSDVAISPSNIKDGQRILMWNGKYLSISKTEDANGESIIKFNNATVTKTVKTNNGYVYYIDQLVEAPRSMYEMIEKLGDDYSIFREMVMARNVRTFDEFNSTIIGVDNTGNNVYDSVFVTKLPYFENEGFDITSENLTATMLIPSNEVINAAMEEARQKLADWDLEREDSVLQNWILQTMFYDKTYTKADIEGFASSEDTQDMSSVFGTQWRTTVQEIDLDNPVAMSNGTAYYVMEHIGGGSLQDKVKADGPMPEREALRYIRQVGDALRYVHGRHVMHLDVKPSNILLRPDGGGAVLIDFGISKRYDEHGSQTSSSPVGISQGYAPLEQYQQGGVESFQPCTDIYSLGATLYFLLTGWRPPEATTVYDSGLPPLPPSVSPRVAAAVARAMSPRRADRPQSAEEFLRLLDDIPVPSPEPEQPLHVLVERDGEDTYVQEKPSIKVQEKRPLSKEKKIGAAAIVLLYLFWFCFGMFTEIFYDYWVNWWDKRNMLPNLVQIGMVAFMLWACYGKKLPPKPLFVSLLIFTGLYVGMYSRNIELMADYGGMASAMAYVYAWGTLLLLPSVCVYAWFKLEKGIPLSVYAKKVRRYLAPFLFLIMLAEGFAMFIVS